MDHCGKHPQQQNQRGETQRKRKERKRSAPAAAADDELSRSKITQHRGKEKKRSGPAGAAAVLSRSKTTQRKGKARKRQGPEKVECSRDFTEEEYQAYNKKYDESDGFDVGEFPDGVLIPPPNIAMPIKVDCPRHMLRLYNEMAELALDKFNKDHGTTFKFVKFIRGNSRFAVGVWYRLTFQAEDQKSGSPQNFQTLVYYFLKNIEVHFCRFEKKGVVETT